MTIDVALLRSLVAPSVALSACAIESVPVPSAVPPPLVHAVASRKRAFAAGRLCAGQALRAAGAVEPIEVTMASDRSPCWPSGFVGAITHTARVAWAVAARASTHEGLGIDAEELLDDARLASIEERILAPEETIEGEGLSRSVAATVLFSAKESFYKCLAPCTGAFFDFYEARVRAIRGLPVAGPPVGSFSIELLTDLSAAHRCGFTMTGRFAIVDETVCTALELARASATT